MGKNSLKDLPWDQSLIESEKQRIKSSLDERPTTVTPQERLALILAALDDLSADESSLGRLRRYIYAVSALVHYERHGGLAPREVPKLIELAHTILHVQGIKPRESRYDWYNEPK